MQIICQIIIVLIAVVGFFLNIRDAINGKKAVNPTGFFGVSIMIILYAIIGFVYYGAGLFSTLIK